MPQNKMSYYVKTTVVLKAVKKIVIEFCPFESNVRTTREFLDLVSSPNARATNIACEVTAMVKHDKSEPVIDVTYADGERLVMKSSHLTCREMIREFQSRCKQKEPQTIVAAK